MDTIYTLKYFRRNYVTFVLVFFCVSQCLFYFIASLHTYYNHLFYK